jgi:superfamily II DNA or RNA helicase
LPRLAVSPDGRAAVQATVLDPARATFLTGALPIVKRTLRRAGVRFRLRDRRTSAGPAASFELQGWSLRDYQEDVVVAALAAGRGLIDVGTSGGKSLLAAALIARLGLPALYLVTTRTLLHQTVESLRRYLGIEPGIIGDGLYNPARVTAALAQSADSPTIDLSPWRGAVLVFDEGHHAAARTYLDLVRRVDPRYHFYLSAVPFRSGADQVVLDALAGPPLTNRRYSAAFLIERGYACPVEVQLEAGGIEGEMHEKPFSTLYREFIVHNSARNRRIVEVASEAASAGKSVLLLVERIEHGRLLLKALHHRLGDASAPVVSFVHGGTGRAELQETTSAFAAGRLRCLVATNGLFQEGVSIEGIHVLVHAGGLKSRAKVVQTVGRGMRRAPGKTHCVYVEFWDDDIAGVFRAHSRQRLRVLKEEGFFVPEIPPVAGAAAHSLPPEEEIPAMWVHVPGSRRFLEIDGDGRVHREALCLKKERVPGKFCEKCRDKSVCVQGGKITWQDGSDCTANRSPQWGRSSVPTAREAGTTTEG